MKHLEKKKLLQEGETSERSMYTVHLKSTTAHKRYSCR